MSKKAQLSERQEGSLKSRVSEFVHARVDATGLAEQQSRQARTLDAPIGLLKDDLALLKQRA